MIINRLLPSIYWSIKMAPLSLPCPLCCNETFSSHLSLKYHLLSMIDNLLCPSCNERCDDLMDLADHLGRECKHLETSKNDEQLVNSIISVENKPREELEEDAQEVPKLDKGSQNLEIKVEPPDDGPHDNELEEAGNKIINIDETGSINENLEKKTTDEEDVQMMYTCQMCNISFSSVQDHLSKFHEGEEVLLETEHDENGDSQDAELALVEYHVTTDDDADDDLLDDKGSVRKSECIVDASERTGSQLGHMISAEERVDNSGMNYTRKVVKVGTDWIKDNQDTEGGEKNLTNDNEEIQPHTTKYLVEEGKVRKITEEEAFDIADKSSIIEVRKCPNCDLQFPNMSHFKKHNCNNAKPIFSKRKDPKLVKIREELRYQCTFCLAIYSSLIALNDHMKSHLVQDETGMVHKKTITMTLHVCDICNTKFPTYKQLRLHSRMHDPVKAKEVDPPVSYNIMGQIKEEAEEPNNLERETFQCHICDKLYDKEYEDVHMKFHEEQENIVCLVCNRKFDTKENLEMHMKAHSNTKKFACSYCKKPFNNYPALEDHVLNQCQKRQYECQYCGRRFGRPHEKVKHERIHTGEKPHVCQVCGRAFRVSYCLTLHMRTHTNTRPYTCQHCGKRFKSHSVFNHHMQTHSDERNYKCPFCPKAFKTAVQLAGHKNSHTKPFTCTECNRPFASLYAVRAHMETHKRDNNLKFDCWICGASYARSFALTYHVSSVHGQTYLTELGNQTDATVEHTTENQSEGHHQQGEDNQMVVEGAEYQVTDNEGEVCQVLTSHEESENEGYVVHLQDVEGSEHSQNHVEAMES